MRPEAQWGQCVLWIRNTVDDAQETYRRLMAANYEGGPEIALLHSRFPFFRREELEAHWIEALGKDFTKRPAHGCVLVSTQVAEQSVDIDADLLITDLAPTESPTLPLPTWFYNGWGGYGDTSGHSVPALNRKSGFKCCRSQKRYLETQTRRNGEKPSVRARVYMRPMCFCAPSSNGEYETRSCFRETSVQSWRPPTQIRPQTSQ